MPNSVDIKRLTDERKEGEIRQQLMNERINHSDNRKSRNMENTSHFLFCMNNVTKTKDVQFIIFLITETKRKFSYYICLTSLIIQTLKRKHGPNFIFNSSESFQMYQTCQM